MGILIISNLYVIFMVGRFLFFLFFFLDELNSL
jgi:hypothetical protein